MKLKITKISEEEIIKTYPIKDRDLGWYFRIQEISNCAFEVEGSDLFGRKVFHSGMDDPDELLLKCKKDAIHINQSIKNS